MLGITGTGGSGKSSLVDELVRRFLADSEDKTIAVLSVDPSKRKSGGALLGDRIRMNAIDNPRVYMRSLATRQSNLALSKHVGESIEVCRAAGFDLIVVETSGIGQSDTEITDHADVALYLMTAEYGAATQLEKIDMLDFADVVAINKFDKRGSLDALRDVKKQWRRNHNAFTLADEDIPVYGTIASQFNDPGMNRLYRTISGDRREEDGRAAPLAGGADRRHEREALDHPPSARVTSPRSSRPARATTPSCAPRRRSPAGCTSSTAPSRLSAPTSVRGDSISSSRPGPRTPCTSPSAWKASRRSWASWWISTAILRRASRPRAGSCSRSGRPPSRRYAAAKYQFQVREKVIELDLVFESLSHLRIPKVSPEVRRLGDLLTWLLRESPPGQFPFTAGVFPLKRDNEDPARMFAGEGGPERTNKRFHYVSRGLPAKRLSTAFDSVTLYGEDPDPRPDIYGKVGNSGVSVASVDDAKKLYSGFDLADPMTSVSMTINGPAPMLLGFFLNAAIDQGCEKWIKAQGRWPRSSRRSPRSSRSAASRGRRTRALSPTGTTASG